MSKLAEEFEIGADTIVEVVSFSSVFTTFDLLLAADSVAGLFAGDLLGTTAFGCWEAFIFDGAAAVFLLGFFVDSSDFMDKHSSSELEKSTEPSSL